MIVTKTMLPGQRWISESEPELGLGKIAEISHRFVVVSFAGSEVERRYALSSAPLRRVQFRKGDEIESLSGDSWVVERVEEEDGLFVYYGEGGSLREDQLSDRLSFNSPEQRLSLGQWDPPDWFQLRLDVLALLCQWYRSPARGLVGGRMSLLPHQLYVVQQAISREQPRLLLADEAGLGKTIEAGLILHHLLAVGRIQRVLLLLPESLVHQWFVELLRRFNLVFQIMDTEYLLGLEHSEPGANPFLSAQLTICSLERLIQSESLLDQALEAGWDMVIVDEAHHIKEGTDTYNKLLSLTSSAWGALLLTATPEQLGRSSHFARLRLLDPERYSDFDVFMERSESYQQLATLVGQLLADETPSTDLLCALDIEPSRQASIVNAANAGESEKKEVVQTLLDRYGMGRVMFRNTRAGVQGFPIREVNLYPLEASLETTFANDPRMDWLTGFLRSHPEEKVVLICKTKEMVQQIAERLPHYVHLPIAQFHEALTLLQRDRNAAWFAEPEGARLLLCSEVGGEGRNFQCARHLVLFDVPEDPEILEQRIGRLDRIGQGERIFLHVPFHKHSKQEMWIRWFHEGLDAFSRTFPAGFRAVEQFLPRLNQLAESLESLEFWDGVEYDATSAYNLQQEKEMLSLLKDTEAFREDLLHQLEAGRNRLLALSSYAPEVAMTTLQHIVREEESEETLHVVSRLFEHLGVEREPITKSTWELQPGVGLHDDFPWLTGDTMHVSFEREFALQHATTVFLSLDHPMIVGAMDLLLGSSSGNCSVALWPEGEQPSLLLEVVFVLECVAPARLNIARFLPPTPVRVVVDHQLEDVTATYPVGVGGAPLISGNPEQLLEHAALFDEQIPLMLKRCQELAKEQMPLVTKAAAETMEGSLGPEVQRLKYLQTINPDVQKDDILALEQNITHLQHTIQNARLRLDAIRFLLKGNLYA